MYKLDNFDVVLVWFPKQEDSTQYLKHPAIVIDNKCYLMSVCSSKIAKPYYTKFDYVLRDYVDAGLDKSTVVKLDIQSHVLDINIIFKIGHLSDYDILNIETLLKDKDLEDKVDIIESIDDSINESKDLKIPKEILQATKNIEYNKITGTNDGSYYLWPMIDDLQNTKDIVKTLRSALPNYEIKSMIDTTSKHRKIRLTTVNDNLLGKIQDIFDTAASKQRLKLVNIQGNLIVSDANLEDLKKLSYNEVVALKNWLELSIWDMNTHGFYLNPIEWINDRILSKYNLYIQVV